MTEFSFNVTVFEQGGLSGNGAPTEATKTVRSKMIKIPSGIQEFTSFPEIWLKKWDSKSESYITERYEGSSATNHVYFYMEKDDGTFQFLSHTSATNVMVDCLKHLGATHARFTAGVGATIHPDSSEETKNSYYYIIGINVSGTAVQWYYSNDRLTHEDMPDAPEKAVKKPYPKALWRVGKGANFPCHELMPQFAFIGMGKLKYINIPESVWKIGKFAFLGTELKSVKIHPECEIFETSFPENCVIDFYD